MTVYANITHINVKSVKDEDLKSSCSHFIVKCPFILISFIPILSNVDAFWLLSFFYVQVSLKLQEK